MTKKLYQPADLFPSIDLGFSQVVSATGQKMVFCAGQVALDKEMNLVGKGDLARQMQQALVNTRNALKDAGAGMEDICRLCIYIVDYKPGMVFTVSEELLKVFDKSSLPALTLLGVQSWAQADLMVGMEATALIES